MNEQKDPGAIEWTRVWGRKGYTWNPVAGCFHDCTWQMPDGITASCYAGTVAERVAMKAYPEGFRHHYWYENRLDEPAKVKEPAGIFVCSMADLFGHWVEDWQVRTVLHACAASPQHVFFLLTKNAPRLLKFELPRNVWVGVSMPPDSFMGKSINAYQQRRMFERSLEVLDQVKATVRWISFEPLSWDTADVLETWKRFNPPIEWAVIGAASSGKTYYQPSPAHVARLVHLLDAKRIPVFYKGNLRGNTAAEPWRQEFPPEVEHA